MISLIKKPLATFLLMILAGNAFPADSQLNLFIWSEYIDPKIISQFEAKESCKVNIDLYEDAESMMSKMQGGGVSLYDVVVPPDHSVIPMIRLKLLSPLRPENIPNLKNLDPLFANPPYDPGNKYTAAYQWGTVGVFYRCLSNQPPPECSWSIFFDASRQAGPFVLIDSLRDTIGAALKYKGYSLNSTNSSELKEARDLVIAAKKRCGGFDGSVGAKNKVLAKAARYSIVYSGEAVRGMTEDKQTGYFIPKEGSQIWLDNLAIPAQAPHRELAERFINYLLDARVGAQLSAYTQFASPNKAAMEFIPKTDLENTAIYPTAEVRSKLEFLKDLGGRTRLYDEVWTQIKSQ